MAPAFEMWGITAYFNPAGYGTKLKNLEIFANKVRQQGLKLLIVELAFPNSPFAVSDGCADLVLRLRAHSVLWQKERMLNLAINRLPDECHKVVWLDADILFQNDSWVEQTDRLLEDYKVVQPYQIAAWLPLGGETRWTNDAAFVTGLPKLLGVACSMSQSRAPSEIMYRPDLAHPGFAWAARREILNDNGLYDRGIVGGGDFLAMLAMYADASAIADPRAKICMSSKQASDVEGWMNRFHTSVAGQVTYTPGLVFHLWHGNPADRKYLERYRVLREFDFDPRADIGLDANECWQWTSDKPELHRRVEEYFASRREDGNAIPVTQDVSKS